MTVSFVGPCLICGQSGKKASHFESGGTAFKCSRCGNYRLSGSFEAVLVANGRPKNWAAISHVLRTGNEPLITRHYYKSHLESASLPHPSVAADNLILWLGQHCELGQSIALEVIALAAEIGATDVGCYVILDFAVSKNWIKWEKVVAGIGSVQLTIPGWERNQELQLTNKKSRLAFMAMKFNQSDIHDLYVNHLKNAVKQTGFDLQTVDESQPAGLIDDHIRLKIRRSNFVLADVSHGNNGAYWEAGFAEGLGLPVIYLCAQEVMQDKGHPHHPHFDTNHHLTVIWDTTDPATACTRLKETIRATLPHDAVLDDN
jgi:nucleoside 2-deoxyribosyltransferase